jgi:hypothetical protein
MAGVRFVQRARWFARRVARAATAVAVASASATGLIVLEAAPAAAGVDRWVSTTGNDNVPAGNTCVNQATPCRTINRAFTVAVATDVIKIAAGTYAERILNVNKAVTFEGLGGQATTIMTATGAPQGAGTVLTITANPVTIKGLTIRNGVGGVFVSGGKVILQDSTVTNNTGTTLGAGVIVNTAPSEAELTNTTVQNNTANNGAGILTLGGKVAVTGGAVQNNITTAIAGNANTGFGGGIFNASTAAPAGLTLTNVAVNGNRANATGAVAGTGGGIYNAGTAAVAGGTISGNQAVPLGNTAGNGGGLYNTGTALINGTTTLTNTTVTNNSATNGAGAMNLSLLAAGSRINLAGGQVTNNTATAISGNVNTGFGGGVYSLAVGTPPLSINGTTISGNRAQSTGTTIGTGGGVYTNVAAQITGATISSNSATNGGGVFAAGTTTIDTSTFSGNSAAVVSGVTASGQGGGLHVASTGNATATGSTFTTNTAANGAGIYSVSRVKATGGAVSDNTTTAAGANTGAGGGIYVASTATPSLELDGVTVSGNKALAAGSVAGQGGGVFHFGGSGTIKDTTITGNSATGGYGGGLEGVDDALTVTGGSISSNTVAPTAGNASTGWGGGIFSGPLFGTATLDLTGVTVSGNQALATGSTGGSGGGVAVSGTATLTQGAISGNSAAKDGGGLYVATLFPGSTRTANLDRTNVTGNTATSGNGGGIYNAGTLDAKDLEISDNDATAVGSGVGTGAGVFHFGVNATLARITLADNHAQAGSALTSGAQAALRNSTVNGNVSDSAFGAVFTTAALTLSNDTVAGNSATAGGIGGVIVFGGTTTVDGTIVAQNTGNCAGALTDGGYNLTDTTGTSTSCAFTNNAVIGDPQLNALGNNGGPTRTMLPKNNSPAINKIPPGPVCPSIDQRNVARPQGTNCDIGSVELEGITAPTLNGPDHALFSIGTPNSVGFTYGGVPTPTLSTTGDALPTGVTLTDNDDGTATLSGTAAAGTAGVYEFTIKAANGESPDATIAFTLTVIDPLVITTTSLPDGEVNVAYNSSVQATGGTTPYTWSIDSGSLPAGLSLNPATGTITGTPTGPDGASTFTVKVTDSTAEQMQAATKQLTISIKAATTLQVDPAILRLTLPSLRLSVINASARLTKAPGNTPVSGQTIRFTAGAQQLCTAVTDANGFAKCPPVNLGGIFAVVLAGGYDAHFDGTATLKPSSGHGQLVSG